MDSNKTFRSLKVDIPPLEELRAAKEKILGDLRKLDPQTIRVSFDERTDPGGRQRKTIPKIVAKLAPHQQPGLSPNDLWNRVALSLPLPRYADPVGIDVAVTDLVNAAKKLHGVLGRAREE